ncbi:hypothetical protein DPMN_052608 [Dreissena polymorpha]|uniref:Prokineticin domain-containing protein n=1 Tax=Dreissena polymorpha TaxID=45954 RepID=A0A9D4CK01_DREPO|nr:hypothetical protein DPMN_052608 [Dreissena polymorpha]
MRVALFIAGVIIVQGLLDDDIPCVIDRTNNTCPTGYCCVRDHFLFSEMFCRKLGETGSPCSVRATDFECPCGDGLICDSNIVGPGHVHSLFGRCHNNVSITTESTSTPDTTTTLEINSIRNSTEAEPAGPGETAIVG